MSYLLLFLSLLLLAPWHSVQGQSLLVGEFYLDSTCSTNKIFVSGTPRPECLITEGFYVLVQCNQSLTPVLSDCGSDSTCTNCTSPIPVPQCLSQQGFYINSFCTTYVPYYPNSISLQEYDSTNCSAPLVNSFWIIGQAGCVNQNYTGIVGPYYESLVCSANNTITSNNCVDDRCSNCSQTPVVEPQGCIPLPSSGLSVYQTCNPPWANQTTSTLSSSSTSSTSSSTSRPTLTSSTSTTGEAGSTSAGANLKAEVAWLWIALLTSMILRFF